MQIIPFGDFEKVELRVGTIVGVQDFPEARVPAYQLVIDFGEFGVKKSSSQLTKLYTKDELLGRQVIGVLNFSPKQVGPFLSEVLTTGFKDENVNIVLAVPDKKVPNGAKLH